MTEPMAFSGIRGDTAIVRLRTRGPYFLPKGESIAASSQAVVFRLLGRVAIRQETPHFLSAPMVCGLLTSMLLDAAADRPSKRPALVDMLWDDPPESAADNLRQYISRLRRGLRQMGLPNRIVTISGPGGGYQLLVNTNELDLTCFNALVAEGQRRMRDGNHLGAASSLHRAIVMWRGSAGIGAAGSALLMGQLERLNDRYIRAVEDYVDTQLALARYDSAIDSLRSILAGDPERERAWVQLARAHYLHGDPALALRACCTANAVLRNRLGAEPGPLLRQIHGDILHHHGRAIAASVLDRWQGNGSAVAS
jgi:DNA-binding SARP family transcriptional activator